MAHGEYSAEGISINLLTKGNPAHTVLHEIIHHLHPELSEENVKRETAKAWRNLDTKKRFQLYQWLFKRSFKQ